MVEKKDFTGFFSTTIVGLSFLHSTNPDTITDSPRQRYQREVTIETGTTSTLRRLLRNMHHNHNHEILKSGELESTPENRSLHAGRTVGVLIKYVIVLLLCMWRLRRLPDCSIRMHAAVQSGRNLHLHCHQYWWSCGLE